MTKQILVGIGSVLLSAILLWFVLRGIQVQQVIDSIQGAHFGWLLMSFIFTILSVATRGIRWRGLLNQRIDIAPSIHLLGVTSMLKQLPLRVGEVARSLIVTRYKIPIVISAASIVIERLLDVFLVVFVIIGVVLQLPDVPQSVTQGALLFGGLGIIAFSLLMIFAHFPRLPRSILSYLTKLMPFLERFKLSDLLENLLDGLQPLLDWRMFSQAIIWTLIAWVCSFLSIYMAARAFGFVENIWLLTLLSGALASLSIAIPVTVASLGLLEGAFIVAGQTLNIDAIAYTALGFSYHGILIISYTLLGMIGIFALGISFKDIVQGKSKG
jgi:glycosyltransferase 2 family protein